MYHVRSLSKMKVVIIGAGIAGVTAAAKLYQNGVKDIIVLEAQNYIGGRIKAELVDGKNLDTGGQYIHGQVDNPVFAIAQALGIAIDAFGSKSEYFYQGPARHIHVCSDGKKVHGSEVRECMTFIEDYIDSTDSLTVGEGESLYDLYMKGYKQYLNEHNGSLTPNQKELLDATFRSFCCRTNVEWGSDSPEKISAWACLDYNNLEGNSYTELSGGMTKIIQAIASLLPEDMIQTSTPVKSIKWNQGEGLDSKTVVNCENGDSFEANHVIVTTSCGCLMRDLLFEPPLPASFTKALEGIQLGGTSKVYLEWERPFWNCSLLGNEMEDNSVVDFLWLESSPIALKTSETGKLTRFGRPWWEGIVGCEFFSSHENMLQIWLTGSQTEVVEGLPDEEVKSVLYEIIKVFFDTPDIPEPIGLYRSKWYSNPYTHGCYSYPTTSLRRSDVDVLIRPVPSYENPQLMFAGEAFHLEHIGTVHGAYMSAEHKADIILHSMGIENATSVVKVILDKRCYENK